VSAIDDLRAAVLAGEANDLASRAAIELADQIAALNAAVFPPAPPATDPAVIAAQPITVDKPQLVGN
jgi:hypothetical protein